MRGCVEGRIMAKVVQPNWSIWARKRVIKLGEAILLANNICPVAHKWNEVSGLGVKLSNSKWQLVEICQNWLSAPHPEWLIDLVNDLTDFDSIKVDWPKFVKWLEDDIQWVGLPSSGVRNLSQQTSQKNPSQLKASPWLIHDPKDPQPKHDWYAPVRYFARAEVKKDPALIKNKKQLCALVSKHMVANKIFKRGGALPHDAETLIKALHKVKLT